MRAFTTSLLAALVAKAAVAQNSPISGYGIEAFEWDVEVAPGQVEVLNGTVQEVYAQVLQINPEFQLLNDEGATVESRGLNQKRNMLCGNFALADKGRIQQGISYLRGLPAAPRNGPRPGNCGRVSCSYNAAIWWCNDNTSPKTLESWNWVAESAQHIINTCGSAASSVSGQNFDSGNWNTIVRGDNC